MNGVERIAAERKRQIEKEKYTDIHDDEFWHEQIAEAAACYALPEKYRDAVIIFPHPKKLLNAVWPWDDKYWKPTPKNRIRELEKAGALIAAEIDRLLRLEDEKNG